MATAPRLSQRAAASDSRPLMMSEPNGSVSSRAVRSVEIRAVWRKFLFSCKLAAGISPDSRMFNGRPRLLGSAREIPANARPQASARTAGHLMHREDRSKASAGLCQTTRLPRPGSRRGRRSGEPNEPEGRERRTNPSAAASERGHVPRGNPRTNRARASANELVSDGIRRLELV
jgi:hypothetical protein